MTAETTERFQLEGNAPDLYETYKVPSLFQPLADATFAVVPLSPGERVLDVACGTGIVARMAASLVGPGGAVTGIDLNAGMIARARTIEPPAGAQIEWREADVTSLPFADAAFDVVFCQQGLQFFPDKPAALAEMHRVLAPGGRLVAAVWCAVSDYVAAVSAALARHVSEQAATRARAPFSFTDRAAIEGLLAGAGFGGIQIGEVEIRRRVGPGERAIAIDMAGTPYAADVAAAGDAVVAAIVRDVMADLAAHAVEGEQGEGGAETFAVPERAYLIQAQA